MALRQTLLGGLIGMAILAIACGPGHAAMTSVTLTGCLQNADRPDVDPATPTATIGKSPGEPYTLTNATSEATAGNPRRASYILDGDMADLRAHVDQQVRVHGTLDATTSNTAGPQRVRVASVDMVAESCGRR